VTSVNAMEMAARHGVEVREQRSSKAGSFAGSLMLRVEGRGPSLIEGTIVLGEPRIMRLNDLRIDLLADGSFLFLEHRDRPGLIGEIGQLLGAANVNIAEMQVGREAPRANAVTAVKVDDEIPPALIAQLAEVSDVRLVHRVEL